MIVRPLGLSETGEHLVSRRLSADAVEQRERSLPLWLVCAVAESGNQAEKLARQAGIRLRRRIAASLRGFCCRSGGRDPFRIVRCLDLTLELVVITAGVM